MMNEDDVNPDVNVTYRTINLYSLEKRFIYFVSDELHLVKTSCNCLSDSDSDIIVICRIMMYLLFGNT